MHPALIISKVKPAAGVDIEKMKEIAATCHDGSHGKFASVFATNLI